MLLELEDVVAHYGRVTALQGVSLHVDTGEFVSVIGPNGAGKSTMLLSIAGAVKPSSGSIRFDGKPIIGLPSEKIVRGGLALVPEGRHIFGGLSVKDNLMVGGTSRLRDGRLDEDIEKVLDLFPILRERFHGSAANLSGGEQQQLAIARALLSKPRLLLLDEPTLGLAPQVIDVVFEALEELRKAGITVLLVEQNAAMAVDAADRSYVLRGGSIELEGTRDELLGMAEFETAYLGFSGTMTV